MEAKRFHGLDGLRGVCAITVMLFHCNDLFHTGPIFQHGFLAVDMFFILSGFVIGSLRGAPEDRLRREDVSARPRQTAVAGLLAGRLA